MQLQHNLSIQQQELIQQLQLVQRQYLIHQGLVKPLHLDLQAQLQTVLTSVPVRTINDKEHFSEENVRMSEKIHDLDALFTINHHISNNNNNNNNSKNYCNNKNNKKINISMKEEEQTEPTNAIKLEYASENYSEPNSNSTVLLTNRSSESVIQAEKELTLNDEELDDEEESEGCAKSTLKSISTSADKNFHPPWPSRMDATEKVAQFSCENNENNNSNAEINNDDEEKKENTRIYYNNGSMRLSKRRISSSASVSPPRHRNNRDFLSPTEVGVLPPISFYGMTGSSYHLDDMLIGNEGNSALNSNHHQQINQELNASKQYFHPLFVHGVCRWPGCELALDDVSDFVKHLNTEHSLDDRSTAQARVQMQVVSQLEIHLQKERDRLQAMMHHLYLTKHQFEALSSKEPSLSNATASSIGNSPQSLSSQQNLSENATVGTMQTPTLNSNLSAIRKRISDKSPLSLAGGLPYMLERAGLDVQQEIQRNREFYKNADVRPPFTYASLIRQNAIRTNLSLHKCFVRYEDDFGSFWMVDDSEFVKRRHLSRGRPRKYEPSSSPNSNSNSQQNSRSASNSSGQKIANASGEECFQMKSLTSIKNSSSHGNGDGDNDGFDICAGSQRNSNNNNNKQLKTLHQIKINQSQPNSNVELGIVPSLIDGYYQANYQPQQQSQDLAHDSNGNFSPNMQNMWPCSPSFDDVAVSSAAALSFGSPYRHYRHHESLRQQMQQQNSQRLTQHDFRLFQQHQLSHQQSFMHHQRQHLTATSCSDTFPNTTPAYISDKSFQSIAYKLEQQQQRQTSNSNSIDRFQLQAYYPSKIEDDETILKTSPNERFVLENNQNDSRDETDADTTVSTKIIKQPTKNANDLIDNEVTN